MNIALQGETIDGLRSKLARLALGDFTRDELRLIDMGLRELRTQTDGDGRERADAASFRSPADHGYITTLGAARATGKSNEFFRKRAKEKEIAAIFFEGKWWLLSDDVEKFR